jgi:hypothetical protein
MVPNHKRAAIGGSQNLTVRTERVSNMKPGFSGRAFLLLALCVAPLRAGTVYVPLAVDMTRGGIRFHTQLFVSNEGTERKGFSPYFIASGTNGTLRGAVPGDVLVDPQKTVFFSDVVQGTGQIGTLELDADPELAIIARMASTKQGVDRLGTEMPVVSDRNLVPANTVSHLEGLLLNATRQTDLGVINLEDRALNCQITLYRADGSVLFGPWTNLAVQPRGHRYFANGLTGLAVSIDTVRGAVSCDGKYFPYALVLDTSTGETNFITPASLRSNLSPPGSVSPTPTVPPVVNPTPTPGGGGNNGGNVTPGQTFTYTENGVFHEATAANPRRRISFPFPKGLAYKKIEVEMDVFMAGWYSRIPDGIHGIFWLARNEHRSNTFAYITARGPNRNLLISMTNVDLAPGDTSRITKNGQLQAGHTYHYAYSYDTISRKLTCVITDHDGGAQFVLQQTITLRGNLIVTEGNGFLMDIGNILTEADVPSIGWKYSNLLLRFTP